jgi:Zn-dependent peptidase ImmA (M78 family)
MIAPIYRTGKRPRPPALRDALAVETRRPTVPGRTEDVEESRLAVGYRVGTSTSWSNPSVLGLAVGRDPVTAIIESARAIAMSAMDAGWSGPPFSILELADRLGIRVVPTAEVRDARIVAKGEGYLIELNPNRPRVRQRFSLAHEIAHTLFPDCAAAVRNRTLHVEATGSDWEIEALCNIAAAELLMPAGAMPEARRDGSIDEALSMRDRFDISAEAVLIRTVQLSRQPIAMFSASRIERGQQAGRYRVDYAIEANAWNGDEICAGSLIPSDSPVRNCAGIGHTQKGAAGFGAADARLECVGVRGYPGALFTRVLGYLVRPSADATSDGNEAIVYLRGDAVEPAMDGVRIVAFLTNNATPNWGGGFARQVATRKSNVQITFRAAAKAERSTLELGSVALVQDSDTLYYAPIIGQAGIGKSDQPRIRYAAIEAAFVKLGIRAAELGASIHMPRIGGGGSGGNWNVVRELIEEHLAPLAPVRVYDLPLRAGRG